MNIFFALQHTWVFSRVSLGCWRKERGEKGVKHENGHHPDLPLRSISHGENELSTDQQDTGKSQNNKYIQPNSMAKRVESRIRQRASDEVKREVKVGLARNIMSENFFHPIATTALLREREGNGTAQNKRICSYQRKVSERQAHKLIDKFNMKQDLPPQSMIGGPDLFKMNKRIYRREESAVEPSPPLGDELGNRI